jgi:hypothetical protein
MSEVTKLYTIATETHECYGHGDFGTEQRIIREGSYACGEFPPCFELKADAQAYLDALDWKHGKAVVEIRYIKRSEEDA